MASLINADNGVVSGSAGVKTTADSSGVLALQTNGTTALSISTAQVVSYTNSPTYTAGTANGVAYLNGSKVLTTGTALVFDGTYLGVGRAVPTVALDIYNAAPQVRVQGTGTSSEVRLNAAWAGTALGAIGTVSNDSFMFYVNNTEGMRLTSTGLGIGTSSPSQKLNVATASGNAYMRVERASQATGQVGLQIGGGTSSTDWLMYVPASSNTLTWFGNSTTLMSLDTSGNLGIGTSSPTSKLQVNGTGVVISKIVDSSATGYSGLAFSGTGTQSYSLGMGGPSETTFGVANKWYLYDGLAGAMRMVVDTSGNLGIGRTPSYLLDVAGTARFGAASTLLTYIVNNGVTNTMVQIGDNATFGAGTAWGLNSSSQYLYGQVAGAERMRIDSSGNLVLGSSSAAAFLDINGGTTTSSAAPAARFVRNNGGNAYSNLTGLQVYWNHSNGDQESNIVYGGASTSYITFTRNNAGTFTETMRLDSSGNLLVGTTTNSGTLTVKGNQYNASSIRVSANGNVTLDVLNASGTEVGYIQVNGAGTGTVYATSSDQRLKENIVDAEDAGSFIDAIQVRQFDWISSGTHEDYGLIAQELMQVRPDAVSHGQTEESMKAVDYPKLVPLLIKEIQSLRVRLNSLENK